MLTLNTQKPEIMSHGVVSPATSSQSSFLNYPKSKFVEPCSCLSFNPHLRPSSLKTQSGSVRARPIKASVQSLYAPTTESFYDLLGIDRESVTPREIKQAYKQLVLKYHPDVSPPESIEENTRRFIRLQEAYETLSDPKSRALYDCDLATGSLMAFSTRRPSRYKQGLDETGEWRIQWMSQLTELKKRSKNKDLRESMSWGDRMRRQRSKTTADHDRN